ncbi:MAG: glutaredoxin 3 [Deltaproteobacteria bacterium]|nr:glutaredoxin 3 [Deltaproteobacteria bacterium]
MGTSEVVVYSTTYCGYCTRAKALLERRGIAFREVDVTHDPVMRDWLVQTTGRRTVPQIFIGGRPIGGFDELAVLDRSGELARLVRTPD